MRNGIASPCRVKRHNRIFLHRKIAHYFKYDFIHAVISQGKYEEDDGMYCTCPRTSVIFVHLKLDPTRVPFSMRIIKFCKHVLRLVLFALSSLYGKSIYQMSVLLRTHGPLQLKRRMLPESCGLFVRVSPVMPNIGRDMKLMENDKT